MINNGHFMSKINDGPSDRRCCATRLDLSLSNRKQTTILLPNFLSLPYLYFLSWLYWLTDAFVTLTLWSAFVTFSRKRHSDSIYFLIITRNNNSSSSNSSSSISSSLVISFQLYYLKTIPCAVSSNFQCVITLSDVSCYLSALQLV